MSEHLVLGLQLWKLCNYNLYWRYFYGIEGIVIVNVSSLGCIETIMAFDLRCKISTSLAITDLLHSCTLLCQMYDPQETTSLKFRPVTCRSSAMACMCTETKNAIVQPALVLLLLTFYTCIFATATEVESSQPSIEPNDLENRMLADLYEWLDGHGMHYVKEPSWPVKVKRRFLRIFVGRSC